MKATRWLLVLAAAALLVGCSSRFEWREVRTEEGFVAALPGHAQKVTRDIDVAGQRVAMTMWSAGVDATMFAIGSARLPPGLTTDEAARHATVAHFRDALVRNISGTVTAHRPASLSLPPGSARKLLASDSVEAIGKAGPGGRSARLAARFFIVDDRLFQVVALGAEGEIPPEALDTFFTSFRLTP